MTEYKIRITAVTPIEYEGKKFMAYKAMQADGTIIDCKFRQDCENKPKEPCFIICDEDKFNLSTKKFYPCLWVQEVKRVEPLEYKIKGSDKFFTVEQYGDFEEDTDNTNLPF